MRFTNLHWRYRSCIERIITPNTRLTMNHRVAPNNMRSGSCIERITVYSLETLYREGLLKKCEFEILYGEDHEYSLEILILYREDCHSKHKVDLEPAGHLITWDWDLVSRGSPYLHLRPCIERVLNYLKLLRPCPFQRREGR